MTYLETSREPLRPIVDDASALETCLTSLSTGTGPVAFDAERAHGHRYWPKAYLFQIRREGAGTWLIDPIALESDGVSDLSALVSACGEATWLIHAASQDLPCMREVGIIPPRIFDTELAARLLGKPGAALGTLLEAELGIRLRKAHSAANWSKRPLPESWLVYAALDVDFLPELGARLEEQLRSSGRAEWAQQEFAATLRHGITTPEPKPDPWRRLTGITSLRSPRQLAVARALWTERDTIARRRDRPPGRILPDSAILALASLATQAVPTRSAMLRLDGFTSLPGKRYLTNWGHALEAVRQLKAKDYPARRPPRHGTPHPREWERLDPEAAQRWAKARPALDELACDLGLAQPSLVAPPGVIHKALFEGIDLTRERMIQLGARPWQADFIVPAILHALGSPID